MLNQAKTDRWPYATVTLIGINVLVFVFELSLGLRLAPFLQQWGFVPVRLSNEVGAHNMLTLATSMFLQVGWLQLLANLWFLWVFGDAVEDAFGWRWFVAIYALSGLFANVNFTATTSGSAIPATGASGAIAGVLGASLVLWPRARLRIPAVLVIFFALMLVYELGLAIGISATVLNIAGGFGIGGGPVLFALSMLLTVGWLVMSAQRRHGGISVGAVLKVWTLPVWLVLVFFCLQASWSATMTIVKPPIRRCGQRLGLPRRARHRRRLGEDPPQAGERANGTGGAGLLPGWGRATYRQRRDRLIQQLGPSRSRTTQAPSPTQ